MQIIGVDSSWSIVIEGMVVGQHRMDERARVERVNTGEKRSAENHTPAGLVKDATTSDAPF